MREHKCLMCDSLYYSNEPGYWGYCSEECRAAKVGGEDAAETGRCAEKGVAK